MFCEQLHNKQMKQIIYEVLVQEVTMSKRPNRVESFQGYCPTQNKWKKEKGGANIHRLLHHKKYISADIKQN